MKTEKLHLSDVRYNPEREAFEALVRIHDAGETFSYPCEVKAPLHAEFSLIARGLAKKAQHMHGAPASVLRSRPAPRTQRPDPMDLATQAEILLRKVITAIAA